MSQDTLGALAGLARRNLIAYEKGTRRPSLETFTALAGALGVEPHELAGSMPPAESPAAQWTSGPNDVLVGRDGDLEELAGVLSAPGLVVVTGPAGVGKTRLARELAHRLAPDFPDGAWFVELASLTDPGLVAHAVARAMAVREVPGRPLTAGLVSALKHRRALLVIDNCEHLAVACAGLIATLLDSCPQLSVLATTQVALGIRGELMWPVAGLTLPDPSAPAGSLLDSEAVSLFCARAAAAKPGFTVAEENLPVVAAICRRLDGIPLALELAAARVTVLAIPEIAARLDERFDLLTEGPQFSPSRHQTLRHALDWSYGLLNDIEQAVLRRLSVFNGGCDLEAAEVVCGEGIGSDQVLAALHALMDRSLIVDGGSGGDDRYCMLETIRLYGAQRLDESGEAAMVGDRHADWCVTLAEEAEPALTGEHQAAWLERLDTERDNLRAALARTIANGRANSALRLAGALTLFWRMRSYLEEGHRWLTGALALDEGRPGRLRVKALWGAGFLAVMINDDAAAREALGLCIELARAEGDRRHEARALLLRGNHAMFSEPTQAGADLARSVDLARAEGDSWCLAHALALLGRTHLDLGETPAARRELAECLSVARRSRDPQSLRLALLGSGDIALARGDRYAARALLTEALEVARTLGEDYAIAHAMCSLGELDLQVGDYESAREMMEQSLPICADAGMPTVLTSHLCSLGELALARGEIATGRRHLTEAASVSAGASWRSGTTLRGLGKIAAAEGDYEKARTLLDEAIAIASARHCRRDRADAIFNRAVVARHEGDPDCALRLHMQALEMNAEMDLTPGIAGSLEGVAGLFVELGVWDRAVRLFAAADSLRHIHGSARPPAASEPYRRDLAAARAALGADHFDGEWKEGSAMTPAAAIAAARRGVVRKPRARWGWAALTGTERDIAVLVANGLTNAQVGGRLFMSPRTVEAHLTRIFAKLRVRSRGELAREAIRLERPA